MKKLFLSIFFLLNISIGFNNGNVKFQALQDVSAQQRMDCPPNPNGGGGGGFWGWLSSAFQNVGGAIQNIIDAISEFFENIGADDGEGIGEEDYGNNNEDYGYDGDSFDNYAPGEGTNLWDDPTFNDYNFGVNEEALLGVLYDYNVYYNYAIAGFPPISDTTRTDTVKATKVPCDTAAISKGNKLTKVYDSVKSKPDKVRLKDSAINGINESGLTIIKNAASSYNIWNFQTGGTRSVEVITSSPSYTCVAGVHSHPNGSANTPSPGDLFHLLEGWAENTSYFADYIIANDGSEFAIMIDDTAKARNFLLANPADSTIALANWDSTRVNQTSGSILYWAYFDHMKYLYSTKSYPLELIATYANTIMLGYELDCGVKMYKKENGVFKQLNYTSTVDNNGKRLFKITICL